MKFLKKYSFLIGIIIFILIVMRLDFSKLITILNEINYFYLFFAIPFLVPMLVIKAYRWNYLKKRQGINYSFKESFLMYGSGMYIGILTPGRLGEIGKIFFLKNDHCSLGKSAVSIVLDRLADLIFLLFFGYFGLLFFFSFFKNFILILSLILVLSLILLIIFLKTNLIQFFLKKIFYLIIPFKYQKSWKINFQDFINELKIYKFKNYLFIFITTFFSWLAYYLHNFLLARSIGINTVSFLFISITITIAALISLLPVSILGLGTRDATLILLLSAFSISQEIAISFSFLILLMAVLMGLICFACWLIRPIQLPKVSKKIC